ncbi:MAG: DUF5711 family protein [Clostridia bacterium]|nr:DUF5711 family protein [Clostridia bacterium]
MAEEKSTGKTIKKQLKNVEKIAQKKLTESKKKPAEKASKPIQKNKASQPKPAPQRAQNPERKPQQAEVKKSPAPANKKAQRSAKKSAQKSSAGTAAILKIILVFFVAISIVFIAARTIGGVTLTSITSDVKVFFQSLGSGDGFPYKTTGESPEKIFCEDNDVFVYSKDKTVLLSPSAKVISELPIEYGSPAVKLKGDKVLIYDRDSAKIRMQNKSQVVFEKELDGTVVSAAIGKKGNFAAAVQQPASVNVLNVYKKNQKELFTRTFKGEKVTSITLSDDGKFAAVSTIRSKDAQINSKVYIFKFDASKPVACFDFEGCAVVSVEYDSAHNISVISNTGRVYIKDNSSLGKAEEFAPDILFKYSNNHKVSAVALKKFGGDNFGTIKIFKCGKLDSTASVNKEIKDVFCTDKYTAVLTSDSVMLFKNSNGKLKEEIPSETSVTEISIKNNRIYMLSPSEVTCKKFR